MALLNEDKVIKLRFLVYSSLFFFSFFIFVGVAVMEDKVDHCPLYADRKDGWGPESNCHYPMAIAIIFQLLYTFVRVVILLLLILGKLTKDTCLFSNVMELGYLLVDIIALLLTFVGACILSAGHNSSDLPNHEAWYSPSRIAQAGAWISTFLWLFIALIGFLFMRSTGRLPCGGAPLRSSEADNDEGN